MWRSVQAVARLPRADFSMLYSMLPIDSLAEDVVAQIKRMRDALEGADFEVRRRKPAAAGYAGSRRHLTGFLEAATGGGGNHAGPASL